MSSFDESNRPSVIIFDHFGVIGVDPLASWQSIHGLSPASAASVQALCSQIDRGQIELWAFYEQLGQLTGQQAGSVKSELDAFSTYNHELLGRLKQIRSSHPVRIGLLSNAHRSLHAALWEAGVHECFDDVVTSQEISGVQPKPDVQLFLHAVLRLGGIPEKTIFFDDRQVNVDGAAAAGLRSFLFTSNEKCFEDLALFGLIT